MAETVNIFMRLVNFLKRLFAPKRNRQCISVKKKQSVVIPGKTSSGNVSIPSVIKNSKKSRCSDCSEAFNFPLHSHTISDKSSLHKTDINALDYQAYNTLDKKQDAKLQSPNMPQEHVAVISEEKPETPIFNAEEIERLVSSSLLEENEKLFVNERVHALTLDSRPAKNNQDETIKWLCDAVDFLDELRLFSSQKKDAELSIIHTIEEKLREQIEKLEGKIINLDTWTPEFQRAISVTKSSNNNQTVILSKGTSGLSFRGELIRKQEVCLAMPQTNGEN